MLITLLMINTNKKNLYFLIFLIIISFLPYVFLSLYANPAGDDFVYAYNGKHFSLIENSVRDYLHWNGRYISNFLVVLNPLAFDSLNSYKLISVIAVLLTFISFYSLVKAIGNNSFSKMYLILFSGGLTLLYLHRMPSLAQGIYWYTGAVTYHLANVLTLFYFSLLINLLNKKYFIDKVLHILICLIFIFVIAGFNETSMILLLFFQGFLFIKIKNRLSFLLFTFSCMCSLLVIFSPGNEVREAAFPAGHDFFHSFVFSIAQSFRFSAKWSINIPLLIASLMYVPLSIHISGKPGLFKNNFYLTPVLSACFLFLVIFLSAFPSYWYTGILGQHRTVNVAYLFFLVLWFINLTVWINYLISKKIVISLSAFSSKYFFVLFLLMILFSFITGNGLAAMTDLLSGRAKDFDDELKLRQETLKSCNRNAMEICRLNALQNKPVSLFVLDISPDENDWMNRGMAAYSGINKVSVRKQDGDGGKEPKRK